MTRPGAAGQVTANGTDSDEANRRRASDEILDEVLEEKASDISAARLLEESRR